MSGTGYVLAVIAVMAAATFVTRALPFLLLGSWRDHPLLATLARRLPPALLALLVIYSLRHVDPMTSPHGLPEVLALGVVVGLHLWRGNALLSIGAGTVVYMVLVQSGVPGS